MPEAETPAALSRRVEIIDYYRLAAALAVVAFHYLYNGIDNGKVGSISHEPIAALAQYGYLGVNLFFMISGYVITASAAGSQTSTVDPFPSALVSRTVPPDCCAIP